LAKPANPLFGACCAYETLNTSLAQGVLGDYAGVVP
jgi:hypothetical protein